jgi:4-hydroxy-tetrahydrodipicolinate reductase
MTGGRLVKIAVHGAAGGMCRRVISLIVGTEDCRLVGALVRPGHHDLAKDAGTLAGTEPIGVPLSSEPKRARTDHPMWHDEAAMIAAW